MSGAATPPVPPVLCIRELTTGYGTHPVLHDVTLQIALGEWCVVLGPNGSGKSTLLYAAAGLLAPRSGRIELSGVPLENAAAAKRTLGYGCAPERLPGLLTGRQCLQVYAAAKGLKEIDRGVLVLAEALGLSGRLERYVDTYSLGMRQKLAVLLALVGAPRLIVLDEAFNGLDPSSAALLKHHLRRLVDEHRAAVLLATHALEIAERYADRLALLLEGRIRHVWDRAQLAAQRAAGKPLEELLAAAAGAP
ncbi:MAG: ATP-binding cassette domain-containing protein [Steroidobacteraceae bacterium]